jgi:proteasome lid subunit RPN8/RPN11
MTLLLSVSGREDIRAHLEGAYPEEGCGLLVGRDHPEGRRIEAIERLPNASAVGRRHRYVIEPETFLAAEQAARMRGLEVVGVFHSHPDHPAEPSSDDRATAWPFYSYLIGSVRAGRLAELRAFRWVAGEEFAPESLEVIEPGPAAGAQE